MPNLSAWVRWPPNYFAGPGGQGSDFREHSVPKLRQHQTLLLNLAVYNASGFHTPLLVFWITKNYVVIVVNQIRPKNMQFACELFMGWCSKFNGTVSKHFNSVAHSIDYHFKINQMIKIDWLEVANQIHWLINYLQADYVPTVEVVVNSCAWSKI